MVSESKTGVTLPYEKAAMNGEEMPADLAFPDFMVFLGLRYLYAQYRAGIIDRSTAAREKQRLLEAREVHQFWEDLGKEWTRNIKATELARAAYRKNRSLENADALLAALEGGKNIA